MACEAYLRAESGGIEYLEAPDGRHTFYDINANSNLGRLEGLDFDPFERVAEYLEMKVMAEPSYN
jgi:hypothetical protein